MFEVGRGYRIVTREGDEVSYSTYTVVEVALPLIKVEAAGRVQILNTSAPSFESAELIDEKARAEQKAEHQKFMDSLSPAVRPL